MVANGSVPKKSNRFAFALPTSRIEGLVAYFRRVEIWARVLICLTAMWAIWLGTGHWEPPFPYRTRYVPDREIVARVVFAYKNDALTNDKRATAASKIRCIYRNDPSKMVLRQNEIIEKLFAIIGSQEYSDVLWKEFYPLKDGATVNQNDEELEKDYSEFRAELLENDAELEKTKLVIEEALKPYLSRGLLKKLQHEVYKGSSEAISVYLDGDYENMQVVKVSDIRILELETQFRESLRKQFTDQAVFKNIDVLVQRIDAWIFSRFTETLNLDVERTDARRVRV
ncbi:MAG: hypothetical protein VX438_17015, partial [Planctomycetota bacterium]|nr:hypothetical protein [Planctomycetota bacterium]